jgi:polar amino acid transport system substrate-binding protein
MSGRLGSIGTCVVAAMLVTAAGTGCGGSSRSYAITSLDALPGTTTTTSPDAAASTSPPTTTSERRRQCEEQSLETVSYAPPATLEVHEGSYMQHLRDLGRIRVGVDENTRGLSARSAESGQIEGFEVDLAHEIAETVFGTQYTPDVVKLIPLVTSEKTRSVANQQVDLTISAISMSCRRWEEVDFTAEYYTAHQEFLVRSDSPIRTRADLDGRVVCVTADSSSQRIMEDLVPDAQLLPVPARTDCLVALQNQSADAYFGHDTFLYGMLLQDPTLEIRERILDPADTVSHYGIAINRQHPEFTRFVNGVLEEIIANGRWEAMATQWLVSELELDQQHPVPVPVPPEQKYGREL